MRKTLVLIAAILVLASWGTTHADTYVGVYGGYSLQQDSDLKYDGITMFEDVEYDNGGLVGGKVGYWMKDLPWVAVELNVWNVWSGVTDESQDITLLNVSGSVLLQYVMNPLRLYAGGGVVGCWADISPGDFDSSPNVGAMAQAGVEWEIVPHWGVFAEYRYVYLPLEFDAWDQKMEFDANSNQFLGGVNFRF